MVLEKINNIKYRCYHMHNFTSMLVCHQSNWSKKILKSVCNKDQAWKAKKMSPICLTDSYNDFILDKIKIRDTIEYEKTSVDETCE